MLPAFLIIGAMKSGTTSLYAYLRKHPDIFMPSNKEPNFFSNEGNWQRGIAWYESLFKACQKKQICGEASVNYTKYPYYTNVPEKIASTIPDVKLIYLLRSPIPRIYSQYVHNVYAGIEEDPFEVAVAQKPLYIQTSLYYTQIQQYLKHFSRKNLLVLRLDEMQENPLACVQKVFRFVGVDSDFIPSNITEVKHRGSAKRGTDNLLMKILRQTPFYHFAADRVPESIKGATSYFLKNKLEGPEPMSAATYNKLITEVADDVDNLARFLGQDLSKWLTPMPS